MQGKVRVGRRCGELKGLPVTSPHGNFATVTSPHGNFATLSYIENLHCLHRNKTLNSRLPKKFYRAFRVTW